MEPAAGHWPRAQLEGLYAGVPVRDFRGARDQRHGRDGPRENCTRAEAAALVTAGIRCTPGGHTGPLTSMAPPLRGELHCLPRLRRACRKHAHGRHALFRQSTPGT